MAKRRGNEQTLKEAIDLLLETYGLGPKLREIKLISEWENVVGADIAKYTKDLNISNRMLFVKCSSAALRHELQYRRQELLKRLNEEAGGDVIDGIMLK